MTRYRGAMRRLAVLGVLLAAPVAHADQVAEVDFEPEARPRELCLGPAEWSAITACFQATQSHLVVDSHPSPHVYVVADAAQVQDLGSKTRLYVRRPDGRWQMARFISAEHTTLVGERPIAGAEAKIRVELREQFASTPAAVRWLLRTKVAIVCDNAQCQQLTYACSYVENGRGKAVLAGEVVVRGGVATVEGDRSLAAPACNR